MAAAEYLGLNRDTVMVWTWGMSDYAAALSRYLDESGESQSELAERVEVTQATISRYKGSDETPPRLPPKEIAEKIDLATNGQVPFSLWVAEMAKPTRAAA